MSKYEIHNYQDPSQPFSLHFDKGRNETFSRIHWHLPYEILYYTKGCCEMMINGVRRTAKAGDLIFLNSNCMHNFHPIEGDCYYHCLTVDPAITDAFQLKSICAAPMVKSRDEELTNLFLRLVSLQKDQPPLYKAEMKALILLLIIRLSRLADNTTEELLRITPQCRMVMKAVSYLQTHFTEPVSVEELSSQLGFSKYYFCRQFKQITGQTTVDYLNTLRCKNARRLLAEGQCNVSESARLSGFNNLSYFAKVYKKHMGQLPSEKFFKNQEKL